MPTPVTGLSAYSNVRSGAPDDGEKPKADDVRQAAATGLSNTRWIRENYQDEHAVFVQALSAPYAIGFIANSPWQDSTILLTVPNVLAGEDLKITCAGTVQLNAALTPHVVGQLRVKVVEAFGTAGANSVPTNALAHVVRDGDNVLPKNDAFSIMVRHRVVQPGDARVVLQGQAPDLSGGSGTGTIILMFAVNLNVTRVRRVI